MDQPSYLDDPDHTWELDPISLVETRDLEQLMEELHERQWDGIGLILQGYAGLKQRLPTATDAQCLDTSMIWYYG